MSVFLSTRQALVQDVNSLPTEALPELATFIEYLRFKLQGGIALSNGPTTSSVGSTFLLAIAGIGATEVNDISERDEEILAAEVDPLRGWGLHDENLP